MSTGSVIFKTFFRSGCKTIVNTDSSLLLPVPRILHRLRCRYPLPSLGPLWFPPQVAICTDWALCSSTWKQMKSGKHRVERWHVARQHSAKRRYKRENITRNALSGFTEPFWLHNIFRVYLFVCDLFDDDISSDKIVSIGRMIDEQLIGKDVEGSDSYPGTFACMGCGRPQETSIRIAPFCSVNKL